MAEGLKCGLKAKELEAYKLRAVSGREKGHAWALHAETPQGLLSIRRQFAFKALTTHAFSIKERTPGSVMREAKVYYC